jgi:hypothetical protein
MIWSPDNVPWRSSAAAMISCHQPLSSRAHASELQFELRFAVVLFQIAPGHSTVGHIAVVGDRTADQRFRGWSAETHDGEKLAAEIAIRRLIAPAMHVRMPVFDALDAVSGAMLRRCPTKTRSSHKVTTDPLVADAHNFYGSLMPESRRFPPP